MYAVISYREALENEVIVRIYNDNTEKHFVEIEDAQAYQFYLVEKYGTPADLYIIDVLASGALNIEDIKKQDALDKLTPEEKVLLGL